MTGIDIGIVGLCIGFAATMRYKNRHYLSVYPLVILATKRDRKETV